MNDIVKRTECFFLVLFRNISSESQILKVFLKRLRNESSTAQASREGFALEKGLKRRGSGEGAQEKGRAGYVDERVVGEVGDAVGGRI